MMNEVNPIMNTMASHVIKLEPIRMGSLVSNQTAALARGQKYLPPNMRAETGPIKVDLGVQNFPSLSASPKKASPWEKMVTKMSSDVNVIAAIPSATDEPTLKDMIKEQIRQAELEEEERQKPKEDNPYKMTREQLLADGWAILPLNSAAEVRMRLNTTTSPAYEDLSEI